MVSRSRHPSRPAVGQHAVARSEYLCIQSRTGNARFCRISSAFDQSLLTCQLRHAGAQAVDVPVGASGRCARSRCRLTPVGRAAQRRRGPARRSPDPGRPARAAGRSWRRGCDRTRSSGGRGRIAGSCRLSRPSDPRCSAHRRPPHDPGSRRRTGPRPRSPRRGCPARPLRSWHPGSPKAHLAGRQAPIPDLPGAVTIPSEEGRRTVPAYGDGPCLRVSRDWDARRVWGRRFLSCIGDSGSRPAAGCASEHLGEPAFRKRIAGLHTAPVRSYRRVIDSPGLKRLSVTLPAGGDGRLPGALTRRPPRRV